MRLALGPLRWRPTRALATSSPLATSDLTASPARLPPPAISVSTSVFRNALIKVATTGSAAEAENRLIHERAQVFRSFDLGPEIVDEKAQPDAAEGRQAVQDNAKSGVADHEAKNSADDGRVDDEGQRDQTSLMRIETQAIGFLHQPLDVRRQKIHRLRGSGVRSEGQGKGGRQAVAPPDMRSHPDDDDAGDEDQERLNQLAHERSSRA